jgi:Asp-tRNA(Asn)/Glu-tRNA(Gln) amidotransferase A subunit family amidase
MRRFSCHLLPLAMFVLCLATGVRAAGLDLSTATIPDLQAAMEKGTLTSEKLMAFYLARIASYDQQGPKLDSILLLSKEPLAEARALDAERKAGKVRGPLHGIPIVVKDVYDVAGLPTAGGFKPMANSFPLRDGFVVHKLREAGAIIFAKTNQSDWFGIAPRAGSTLGGQAHNPYDLTRIPGSSSSGTAAAVASWFCAAGLGSDTGGSVQTPAADTNLYSIVSTRGAISRTGQICTSTTTERAGPICRDMTDLAVMLSTMVGFDAEDLSTAQCIGHLPAEPYTAFLKKEGLKGARIGVFRQLFRGGPRFAEGYRLADEALGRLKAAGAVLVDTVDLDFDIIEALEGASVGNFERKFAHNWYLSRLPADAPIRSVDEMIAKAPDIVSNSVRQAAKVVSLDHNAVYLARLKKQEMIRDALVALMDKYRLDVLVYPYKTSPAAKIVGADVGRDPEETAAGNANTSANTGLPALVLPAGLTKDGLPIGMEFLGRPWSEPTLIALGYAYEQASPPRLPPPYAPALPDEDAKL